MVFGKSLLGAPSGSSPTRTSARNGLRRSVRRIRRIDPGQSRSRQPEYARRLLPPRLLLDVVPNLGGGKVLAAEGMRVDLRGGGHRRVAEAFADGRAKTRGGFSRPNRRGKSHESACLVAQALAIRPFRRPTDD